MSTNWLHDPVESSDPLGGAGYDEADFNGTGGEAGESYTANPYDDAESGSGSRRARARRVALARSRAERAGRARGSAPSPPTSTSTAVRNTQVAVRDLDLVSKVQADAFGGALAAQGKRIDRAELAMVASIVERQLVSSFPNVAENRLVAAGLRGAPVLLLKPARRGSGLGGYASDPRVLGVALMAGLTIAGEISRKSNEVSDVRFVRSERELPTGSSLRFRADPLDARDRVISEKRRSITWKSSDETIATVDANGVVVAKKAGTVTITASLKDSDLSDQAIVTVSDPATVTVK